MKLAVFLPNWIGDAVMAGPTLRALRQRFGPQSRMVGIMRPYVADVLAGTPWLNENWFVDTKSANPQFHSLELIRRLRSERFDLAILLTNSFRTAAIALAGGIRQRVGYVRYGRGFLLTKQLRIPPLPADQQTAQRLRTDGRAEDPDYRSGRLEPPRYRGKLARTPMVDYYLALAEAVGCPPQSPRLELATTADDEGAANLVWEKFRLRRQVVVLNSSGAFGAAKLWPVEHFGQLARRVAERCDRDLLVLCGPSEREIARQVVQVASHPRVFSLADEQLSIGLSKACVRRGRLMVTTDSGPRHFAVAFGVPVIGLYGPTPPVWGDNPTANAVDLQQDLPCLGCHQRTCPLGHHRCMRDLSVDRVFEAVSKELAKDRQAAAA